MRASLRLLGVAAGMLAALAATAEAGAAPASGTGSFATLVTQGANGFQVVVTKAGGRVFLSASKGGLEATYTVPALPLRGDGIKARFGKLGGIAVRFRPPRSQRRRPCDVSTAYDLGTFRGAIRFRGELGYTGVDARRARGLSFGTVPRACTRSRAGRGSAAAAAASGPTIATHLAAIRKLRGGALSLDALAFRRGKLAVYAQRTETSGRMEIVRTALAEVGGKRVLRATGPGRHPAYARLAPPKPFSGSAVFREGPRYSATFTGSLAVRLPGAGRVPLAGPGFASSLCRRAPGESGCGLYPTVQRPLPGDPAGRAGAQTSGSHSQACAESRSSLCARYRRNSAISSASIP